jgi:Family of unknown function (DUF5677)
MLLPNLSDLSGIDQDEWPRFNRARQLDELWLPIESPLRALMPPLNTWEGIRIRAALRGRNDFLATTSLALAGLGMQALVQARALMELAINIDYIAKSPNERVTMYSSWFDYFFVRLVRSGQLKGEWESFSAPVREEFERTAAESARTYTWRDSTPKWTGRGVHAMAKEVGMLAWYELNYAVYSEITHGGPFGISPSPRSFALDAVDQANHGFAVLLSHGADVVGRPVESRIREIMSSSSSSNPS